MPSTKPKEDVVAVQAEKVRSCLPATTAAASVGVGTSVGTSVGSSLIGATASSTASSVGIDVRVGALRLVVTLLLAVGARDARHC